MCTYLLMGWGMQVAGKNKSRRPCIIANEGKDSGSAPFVTSTAAWAIHKEMRGNLLPTSKKSPSRVQ